MYQYELSSWLNLKDLTHEYFKYLTAKPDIFWDDAVYRSDAYLITKGSDTAGFFGLAKTVDGTMLTVFYLRKKHWRDSERLYDNILSAYSIINSYVLSCDELSVSLAFSKSCENHSNFEIQAYFSSEYDNENIAKAQFGIDFMQPLMPHELPLMNELTDFQWNDEIENESSKFWCLRHDDEILGYGAICRHTLNPQLVDIGNHVAEKHRKKGVGRSILMNLRDIAVAQGNIPVVGCWYYNKPSCATLLSSGFYSVSRLFKVWFNYVD